MEKQEASGSGGFLSVFHEERLVQLGAAFLIAHSGAGFLESLIEDLLMPFLLHLEYLIHLEDYLLKELLMQLLFLVIPKN